MLLAAVLLYAARGHAQQGVIFSQYAFNGLVLNPAYAGYKEKFNSTVLYRNQWANIEGSPTTISLLVDGAMLNNLLGVGGHIMSDKVGVQQTLSFFTDYSYRVQLDRQGTRLAFGLSIGATQLSLDETMVRLHDNHDPLLTGGLLGKPVFRPDFNVGVFLDHKRFSLGLSATELWRDYKLVQKNPQLYFTAATLIPINRHYIIKPSIFYKDDFIMQPSIDLNVFLLMRDKVWLGVLWRNGLPLKSRLDKTVRGEAFYSSLNALTFLAELFVSDNLYLGYAYDFPLSKLNQVTLHTHEVMLGFTMGKKAQRVLTPRYF
ncbi:MAG: PorP/SprF family type IX secretion system membrane protein [Prevotellaceae bacterium]|jgi:type IX secretion system PorP/SprF family membrane protein|nr:PorP/SprF family type IX secretion system membrane protein [Prevotellaceae bacterium]